MSGQGPEDNTNAPTPPPLPNGGLPAPPPMGLPTQRYKKELEGPYLAQKEFLEAQVLEIEAMSADRLAKIQAVADERSRRTRTPRRIISPGEARTIAREEETRKFQNDFVVTEPDTATQIKDFLTEYTPTHKSPHHGYLTNLLSTNDVSLKALNIAEGYINQAIAPIKSELDSGNDDSPAFKLKHIQEEHDAQKIALESAIAKNQKEMAENPVVMGSPELTAIFASRTAEMQKQLAALEPALAHAKGSLEQEVAALTAQRDALQATLATVKATLQKFNEVAKAIPDKIEGEGKESKNIILYKKFKPGEGPSGGLKEQLDAWAALVEGHYLDNARRFLALDDEEETSMPKITVLQQLQGLVRNGFDEKDLVAILSGSLVIPEGQRINRANPRKGPTPLDKLTGDERSRLAPERAMLHQFLLDDLYKNVRDLRDSGYKPPSPGAGRTSPPDIQAVQEKFSGGDAVLRAPKERKPEVDAADPDTADILGPGNLGPSTGDGADNKPVHERIEEERERRRVIFQKKNAADIAAEREARLGHKPNTKENEILDLIDEGEDLLDDPYVKRDYADRIEELLSEDSPELAQFKGTLQERLAGRITQLEDQVEELQTPENLLAGGDLKGALLRMKQVSGANPSKPAAIQLIQSVVSNVDQQDALTVQLDAAIAEVSQIEVKEDSAKKRKGPRR